MCLAGGLGKDYDPADKGKGTVYDIVENWARQGYRAPATWHIRVDWRTRGQEGKAWPPCKLEYFEVLQPKQPESLDALPAIYGDRWKWSEWNKFHEFGGLATDNADWNDIQRCPKSGEWHYSDYPAVSPRFQKAVAGSKLLVFARVVSGCKDCKTCCAMLMIDYDGNRVDVLGPTCDGAACANVPPLRGVAMGVSGKSVVDADASFKFFAAMLRAIALGNAAVMFQSWRLSHPASPLSGGAAGEAQSRCGS